MSWLDGHGHVTQPHLSQVCFTSSHLQKGDRIVHIVVIVRIAQSKGHHKHDMEGRSPAAKEGPAESGGVLLVWSCLPARTGIILILLLVFFFFFLDLSG